MSRKCQADELSFQDMEKPKTRVATTEGFTTRIDSGGAKRAKLSKVVGLSFPNSQPPVIGFLKQTALQKLKSRASKTGLKPSSFMAKATPFQGGTGVGAIASRSRACGQLEANRISYLRVQRLD